MEIRLHESFTHPQNPLKLLPHIPMTICLFIVLDIGPYFIPPLICHTFEILLNFLLELFLAPNTFVLISQHKLEYFLGLLFLRRTLLAIVVMVLGVFWSVGLRVIVLVGEHLFGDFAKVAERFKGQEAWFDVHADYTRRNFKKEEVRVRWLPVIKYELAWDLLGG